MRLGFLASRNGTDMQAIIQEIEQGRLNATAEVIISNNSKSPALQFAQDPEHNIPSCHISSVTSPTPDLAIVQTLQKHGVNLLVLSGYMKRLGVEVYGAIPTLNVHPADTKKYGGEGMYGDRVHEAVLASGDEFTYPTIHVVESDVMDEGRILAQGKVEVLPNDTVETLRPRVQTQEKVLYIGVLQDIKSGGIVLSNS